MKTTAALTLLMLSLGSVTANATVTFDWATVGNAGNVGDPTVLGNFGGVSYTYRISKHEVTNNQYANFLNKVAAADPNGLFNSNMHISQSGSSGSHTYAVNAGYGQNPVNSVSFFDAMRFVNWLEKGQGTGDTESGVYTISDGVSETRAANATYFIPSENEWYKAAYYDPTLVSGIPGGYWDYPTQSDTAPFAQPPPGGENSANADFVVGDTTPVGAYPNSTSFYGTFDQAGNVYEWNEAVPLSGFRGFRSGGWQNYPSASAASVRDWADPTTEGSNTGFRVASLIPEPSSLLLGTMASIGLMLRRRGLTR